MAADATSASTEQYQDVKCPANGEPRDAATLLAICVQPIVNCLRFIFARLQELIGLFAPLSALIPGTLSVASSTITLNGHGLSANDPVRVWAIGGSLPSPLVQGTSYYVVGGSLTSNTFQVSATSGGGAITLTTTGSGSLYVAKVAIVSFWKLVVDSVATFNGAASINGLLVANNSAVVTGSLTQSGGNNTLGGDTIIGGVMKPQVSTAPVSSAISPTATAVTIDASKPVWTIDTPNPSGGTMVVTLDSSVLVPETDAEIEVICFNPNVHSATVQINRAGPTTLVTFVHPDLVASAKFKFIGGAWRTARVGFAAVGATDPASFVSSS
jgi:hypothetical protein